MASARLALLASESSWYFRQLQSAASKLNVDVIRLDFGNLAIGLSNPENLNSDSKVHTSLDFDAVLVRTMPIGSLEQVIFRMDVLRAWESLDVPVFNSPICLETSIDKLLTLDSFRRANIPFPETYACQNADQAMEAFERLGYDIVVKPIFGGEGRGIIRICEVEVAYRIFKSLEYARSVIYCQKFVANTEKEFRILFIGDQPFAMQRSSENSWIRNAAQGGTASPYQPTEDEIELARRSANAVSGQIVGVDILQDVSGKYYVLEVNAVPGWKMLQRVTNVDIATEVIKTVVSK